MEICPATSSDIPEIVQLLKMSLGESLMPKSEQFWRWKHEYNIFGPSKVIIAKEMDQIVGVRAFMNWQWQNERKRILSVRAVDTATHPDFQGKGIFKKLTLRALEVAAAEGMDLVFNTPNASSKPGYLKMGWKEVGRIPLLFKVGSLFPKRYSFDYVNKIMDSFSIVNMMHHLPENFENPVQGDAFQTQLNFGYLKWRYADCPVAKYGIVMNPNDFGFVFRLKKIHQFIEFRVCDIWLQSPDKRAQLNQSLNHVIKLVKPLMVSVTPSPIHNATFDKIKGYWGPFAKGPIVTIRNLSDINFINFELSKNWIPSLGSMELF